MVRIAHNSSFVGHDVASDQTTEGSDIPRGVQIESLRSEDELRLCEGGDRLGKDRHDAEDLKERKKSRIVDEEVLVPVVGGGRQEGKRCTATCHLDHKM